ncbi:helix-turn-helix domain-containing protein [Frankia sp. AvcI1]|uniref:helix-turn-helix domain-containing protein n=1 Tax=Frankia sp. AvcI1 TaxID=573496 RepID=UPI0021186FB6|nr:helix-turn-helix domain-containing protein [Frankia sp. AvcI1]
MKSIPELLVGPPTLPLWPDVAEILGMGKNTALDLAASGRFPTPVFKHGLRWIVPVGHLLELLGFGSTAVTIGADELRAALDAASGPAATESAA